MYQINLVTYRTEVNVKNARLMYDVYHVALKEFL